jgi:hypothetical protein
MRTPHARTLVWSLAVGLVLCGCAGTPRLGGAAYRYFVHPAADDPWSAKIAGWQARERVLPGSAARGGPASVSGSGDSTGAAPGASDLRAKFQSWRSDRKRSLAREVAQWIQREAREHYVPDGAVDHWATLEETLERNGDDCDGLELLVNQLLRDLGFGADEVYRAIVYRPADGQHHMVTFWFETPDDPWIIDPTGAMTTGMPRMSEVPGWVPLKVFSDTANYSVERIRTAAR